MVSGWSSIQAHIHAPRRSHDQPRIALGMPDVDEIQRRSSTDARPTPPAPQDPDPSSNRLALFAEKLLPSSKAHSPPTFLHPHIHRGDSAFSPPNPSVASSMASSSTIPIVSKSHVSPSKACFFLHRAHPTLSFHHLNRHPITGRMIPNWLLAKCID